MQNTNRGFTLIELMIVVAILAIISAIAIPAYTGYITTAKLTEAQNNLAALRLAEEEFFLENNTYFGGATTALVEAASQGLWTATAGNQGAVAFNYSVTITPTTWTATALGNLAGSTFGETIIVTK